MKSLPRRLLSILLTASALQLHAYVPDQMLEDGCYQEEYSWELSDSSQHKQAVGMVVWGFVMAAATALLAGFLVNSPSATSTTGTSSSGKSLNAPTTTSS